MPPARVKGRASVAAPPSRLSRWEALSPVRPWWALLPLRAFLGVTFTFAGLQKLANPSYLNGSSPQSVQAMIHGLQHQSPIGFLLAASSHAPVLVGLLIAFGELCVGLATLLGLWVRLAAVGGLLLALTFFLTVSWRTRPYYYGSDIVFVMAWTAPLALGAWGGPAIDAVVRRRAATDPDPQRRSLMLGGAAAAGLAGLAAVAGGIAAAAGRALQPARAASSSPPPPPSTHPATRPGKSTSAPTGRTIARTSDVPAGQAASFSDNSGAPALLVHEPTGEFRAFRAVCTHAGCTVGYDAGQHVFVCPCHGGVYDAGNGAVVGGPPPSPLPQLPVHVANGEVRLT